MDRWRALAAFLLAGLLLGAIDAAGTPGPVRGDHPFRLYFPVLTYNYESSLVTVAPGRTARLSFDRGAAAITFDQTSYWTSPLTIQAQPTEDAEVPAYAQARWIYRLRATDADGQEVGQLQAPFTIAASAASALAAEVDDLAIWFLKPGVGWQALPSAIQKATGTILAQDTRMGVYALVAVVGALPPDATVSPTATRTPTAQPTETVSPTTTPTITPSPRRLTRATGASTSGRSSSTGRRWRRSGTTGRSGSPSSAGRRRTPSRGTSTGRITARLNATGSWPPGVCESCESRTRRSSCTWRMSSAVSRKQPAASALSFPLPFREGGEGVRSRGLGEA